MRRACALLLLSLLACRPRADAPACASTRDCQAGESCIDGQCQACRSDADCDPLRCVEFRCEAVAPNACGSTSDCELGLTCVDQTCQPCTDDEMCPTGLCHPSGRCELPPCATDEDCPAQEICDGGQCLRASMPEEDGPCGPGVIHFARDSARLSPGAQQRLTDATACLVAASVTISASGEPLDQRRADTVRSFLLGRGLTEAQLRVTTEAELAPASVHLRVE